MRIFIYAIQIQKYANVALKLKPRKIERLKQYGTGILVMNVPTKYLERINNIQRFTPWYELRKEIEALVAEAIEDTEKGCMKKYTGGKDEGN